MGSPEAARSAATQGDEAQRLGKRLAAVWMEALGSRRAVRQVRSCRLPDAGCRMPDVVWSSGHCCVPAELLQS